MIAILVARLVGAGIPARLAKPILAVGAVIAGLILLWIVASAILKNHDQQVIERHDSKVNLDVIERVQNMDKMAADQRVSDAVRQADERNELEKVTTNEAIPLPDRRRAYYDRVREQQAAARRAASADR